MGRSRAARRAGASDSPCPVDARCGGCKNLCVPYTKQLIDKQLRIERLFAPLAPDGTISLIKGMKDPYHYRNKVISPFAPGKKLPPRGQDRKAIDPHNCKAADVRGAKGGKGKRSQAVIDACVRNRCVYFAAVGGIAALLAKHVTESETVAWDDLGTEALRRIELIDFPVFVAVDSQGGDLYRAIESGEQL